MAFSAARITGLNSIANPGAVQSFSAKTAAALKGTGPFTALSVLGLPGQRQSFSTKTPAVGGKGTGPFTELSIMATPGQRHSFSAKTAAVGGYTFMRTKYWHKSHG